MVTVLALGFDLFFKPKLTQAAQAVGVDVRHVPPGAAAGASRDVARVVADASAPGVVDALRAVRAARPDVPIVACYPHVDARLAHDVAALGGVAITRGAFAQRLPDALAGRMDGAA